MQCSGAQRKCDGTKSSKSDLTQLEAPCARLRPVLPILKYSKGQHNIFSGWVGLEFWEICEWKGRSGFHFFKKKGKRDYSGRSLLVISLLLVIGLRSTYVSFFFDRNLIFVNVLSQFMNEKMTYGFIPQILGPDDFFFSFTKVLYHRSKRGPYVGVPSIFLSSLLRFIKMVYGTVRHFHTEKFTRS